MTHTDGLVPHKKKRTTQPTIEMTGQMATCLQINAVIRQPKPTMGTSPLCWIGTTHEKANVQVIANAEENADPAIFRSLVGKCVCLTGEILPQDQENFLRIYLDVASPRTTHTHPSHTATSITITGLVIDILQSPLHTIIVSTPCSLGGSTRYA